MMVEQVRLKQEKAVPLVLHIEPQLVTVDCLHNDASVVVPAVVAVIVTAVLAVIVAVAAVSVVVCLVVVDSALV